MKLVLLSSLALVTITFTACKEEGNPAADDLWEKEHRNMTGSGTNSEGAGGGAPMSNQVGQDNDKDLVAPSQPEPPPSQPRPELLPQPHAEPAPQPGS